MIVRLLPSYRYALHWLAVWKLLDMMSTYLAYTYSPLQLTEINVLITLLAPVTGFNTALVVTTPLAFAILYYLHQWNPVVSEVIALMLPFIVLGNVLTVVSNSLHLAVFAITISVPVGHCLLMLYRSRCRTRSWREWSSTGLEPLFWQPQRTPDDADTGLFTTLDQIERARNQAPETGQGGQPGGPNGSANPPM